MNIVPDQKTSAKRLSWIEVGLGIVLLAMLFFPVTRVVAIVGLASCLAVSTFRQVRDAVRRKAAPKDLLDSDRDDNIIH